MTEIISDCTAEQLADILAAKLCGDLPASYCESLGDGHERYWTFCFYGANASYPSSIKLWIHADGSLYIEILDFENCPVWRRELRRAA